jgi:hypothetical protein
VVRFSTQLEGSPAAGTGQVVVDWGGWLDLFGRADDVDQPLKLKVSPASWLAFPRFALAHPDPTIKLAGLLALLSLGLGILSVALTLFFRFVPDGPNQELRPTADRLENHKPETKK